MQIKIIQSCYVPNHPFFNCEDVVEVSDTLAKILIEQKLAVENVAVVEDVVDYSDFSMTELRNLLREKGLATKGKKDELISRLEGGE